ncbi:hypothetical protein G6F46_014021 [Rhizopus delemar]|nr:hypothetical protein G6F46_014021 [Rhizopus delemar]
MSNKQYIIKVKNANNKVWTAVKEDIKATSNPITTDNQIWIYSPVNGGIGFINKGTGKRAGRNRFENLKCEDPQDEQGSWQTFYIEDDLIKMTIDDKLVPLYVVNDDEGTWFSLHDRTGDGVAKIELEEYNS